MTQKNAVYVVDDDQAARNSLALLMRVSGYEVRTFSTPAGFINALPTLPPGCVLLDLRMPGITGMQTLRTLAGQRNAFPTVIVTGHGDVPLAVEAMQGGAVDFVEKPFDKDKILCCVAKALSNLGMTGDEAVRLAKARIHALTTRERQVLECVLSGHSNRATADQLGLSPRTIEIHRSRMMDRLGVRKVAQAVQLAFLAGFRPDPASPGAPRLPVPPGDGDDAVGLRP